MYTTINLSEDVLREMKKLAGDERDLMLSHVVNQGLRFYLKHIDEANAERRREIDALGGSIPGEPGRQLAERVAAIRNEPWRRRSPTEDERLDLIERLGGSLAGPKGEAFAERVAAVRTQPWR